MMVDDHIALRDALGGCISEMDQFEVIAVASNGNEAIHKLEIGTIPDMMLLDLSMPGLGGYETAKIVCSKYPLIKVVIFTMFNSDISLTRLIRVGAKAFLRKDIEPLQLQKALEYIANGGFFYGDKEMGKFTEILRDGHDHLKLFKKNIMTETEITFLQLASTDLTYKAIADIMQMSPRKIDHFRDNLFAKLDVKSRVGLAMFAFKNGLVNME